MWCQVATSQDIVNLGLLLCVCVCVCVCACMRACVFLTVGFHLTLNQPVCIFLTIFNCTSDLHVTQNVIIDINVTICVSLCFALLCNFSLSFQCCYDKPKFTKLLCMDVRKMQFILFSQLNKQAVFCSYISIPKCCTDIFVLLCQLM